MSRALTLTPERTLATRRAGLLSAPLPTTTLLLTIGSLPLPPRDQCTG
jgi:hypothetical protein